MSLDNSMMANDNSEILLLKQPADSDNKIQPLENIEIKVASDDLPFDDGTANALKVPSKQSKKLEDSSEDSSSGSSSDES